MTRIFTLVFLLLGLSTSLTSQETNDTPVPLPCHGALKIKKTKNKEAVANSSTGNPAEQKNCGSIGLLIEDCEEANLIHNVTILDIDYYDYIGNPVLLNSSYSSYSFAHALLLDGDFCNFNNPIPVDTGLYFEVAIDYDANNYPPFFSTIASVEVNYSIEYSDISNPNLTNETDRFMIYSFLSTTSISPEFKCFEPISFPRKKDFGNLVVYPNPMIGESLSFSYDLANETIVTARLLDEEGNLRKLFFEEQSQDIAHHEFEETVDGLEEGQFYYFQLISESELITLKIFKQ